MKFSNPESKTPTVMEELQNNPGIDMNKKLKFSTRFRSTIYSVMLERGWEEASDAQEFDIAWLNKDEIAATYELQTMRRRRFFINHYQSHQNLSRKDLLAQNVQKFARQMRKQSAELGSQYQTIPQTYILPENYAAFVRDARQGFGGSRSESTSVLSEKKQPAPLSTALKGKISAIQSTDSLPQILKNIQPSQIPTPTGEKWIVKPACLLQGQGIFIATVPEIEQWYAVEYPKIQEQSAQYDQKVHANLYAQYQKRGVKMTRQEVESNFKSGHDLYLIQKYIENPLLVNGHKFDCRVYVLVRSFRPLDAYICNEGFARFALKRYASDDLSAHLTNVAIQKKDEDYDPECEGAKWSLFKLCQHLQLVYGKVRARECQRNVEVCIRNTLEAVADIMTQQKESFEVYGFDVMLTSDLEAKICEVNACPSLSADTAEDELTKKRMLHDALSLAVCKTQGEVYGCFHRLASSKKIFGEDPARVLHLK